MPPHELNQPAVNRAYAEATADIAPFCTGLCADDMGNTKKEEETKRKGRRKHRAQAKINVDKLNDARAKRKTSTSATCALKKSLKKPIRRLTKLSPEMARQEEEQKSRGFIPEV